MKKRAEEVLEFIKQYLTKHQILPSTREIGDAVGMKSTNTVHYHLEVLEEIGKIEIWKGVPRGIRVVGAKWSVDGKEEVKGEYND